MTESDPNGLWRAENSLKTKKKPKLIALLHQEVKQSKNRKKKAPEQDDALSQWWNNLHKPLLYEEQFGLVITINKNEETSNLRHFFHRKDPFILFDQKGSESNSFPRH